MDRSAPRSAPDPTQLAGVAPEFGSTHKTRSIGDARHSYEGIPAVLPQFSRQNLHKLKTNQTLKIPHPLLQRNTTYPQLPRLASKWNMIQQNTTQIRRTAPPTFLDPALTLINLCSQRQGGKLVTSSCRRLIPRTDRCISITGGQWAILYPAPQPLTLTPAVFTLLNSIPSRDGSHDVTYGPGIDLKVRVHCGSEVP